MQIEVLQDYSNIYFDSARTLRRLGVPLSAGEQHVFELQLRPYPQHGGLQLLKIARFRRRPTFYLNDVIARCEWQDTQTIACD